jgi:hypothetical protein
MRALMSEKFYMQRERGHPFQRIGCFREAAYAG